MDNQSVGRSVSQSDSLSAIIAHSKIQKVAHVLHCTALQRTANSDAVAQSDRILSSVLLISAKCEGIPYLIMVSGAGGSIKSKCTRSSIPSFSSVSTTVSYKLERDNIQ